MAWGGETDDELSDWYMQAQYFHNGSHAQAIQHDSNWTGWTLKSLITLVVPLHRNQATKVACIFFNFMQ